MGEILIVNKNAESCKMKSTKLILSHILYIFVHIRPSFNEWRSDETIFGHICKSNTVSGGAKFRLYFLTLIYRSIYEFMIYSVMCCL